MEAMHQDIRRIKSAICDEDEMVADFLPAPLSSIEDVKEFEEGLDDTKRKKMVYY
jgi:hypothetical protein